MQTTERDNQVRGLLKQEHALPADPKKDRVVLWKIFRSPDEALEYSHHILLEPDQKLVGGCAADTVGKLWWLGVEVADLEAWGNSQAIQLTDPFDANDPKGKGQGMSS